MSVIGIPEFYTDQIQEVGQVKRVHFFCRIELEGGVQEWHYFGVDPAVRPPPPPFDAFPVFEHPFVAFPQGLDDLTLRESEGVLYEMGKISGFRREGLTNPND